MNNPYIRLLRICWQYASGERKKFMYIYSSYLLVSLTNGVRPWLYGWFVYSLEKGQDHTFHYAWIYVAAYIGLALTEWAINGPSRIAEKTLALHISQEYKYKRFISTLQQPMSWHQDRHSGELIDRMQRASRALQSFFANGALYFSTVSSFVISVASMIYFTPLFAVVGIVLGMATAWVIFKFDQPLVAGMRSVNEKEHVVSSTLFDSLSNINTIITLRLEKPMYVNFRSKLKSVFGPYKKTAVLTEWKWFISSMMVIVIYCTLILGYIYQHNELGGSFYIGGLVTLVTSINQFTNVFFQFGVQYNQIIQFSTDVSSADVIQDSFIQQSGEAAGSSANKDWEVIKVDRISFEHRQREKGVRNASLHNIHLTLRRGARIAIVGSNGSGKTTLFKVLRGLYECEGKATLISGQEESVLSDLSAVHEMTTLIPQEVEIFESSIRFNISMGQTFDDEYLIQLCELTLFSEVLNKLPKGLDTHLGEKGVNLSGGERQRLGLTRGLLAAQERSILMLDEPTSSMDQATEAAIYQNLFKKLPDTTIISSLHRLHLLPKFDYIYVMEHGNIVGQGSFDYLKRTSNQFNQIWYYQETQDA